jgi:N-acetylglucosaminyldiphosphoundecaprenol N-acetyl-beta-D-mannosaminyltransferase
LSNEILKSHLTKTRRIPSVRVMDVPLYDGNIKDAATYIIDQIGVGSKHSYCISATGAHGIVTSRADKSFRDILNAFHINLPDGMPGVWVGRLKGAKRIARCYGPEFFAYILNETSNKNINHYFCGGKEGVTEALKRTCETRFHNHNVAGTYSPPFRDMTGEELTELSAEIERCQTNILWVGISTPKQEKLAYRISQLCSVNFIITVGAAFDFHTGRVRQAPRYVQNIGLEWFYRLCMEPRRLWSRYINIVPQFIYYNMLDFFTSTKNNS